MAGLLILGVLLRRSFSTGVSALTLAALYFGTNLPSYQIPYGLFSHVYSFFALALLMLLTVHWCRSPQRNQACGLGLACALVFLIRPPNAVFWCLIPCYLVLSPGCWRGVWPAKRGQMLIIAGLCLLVIVIHFGLLRWSAGVWILNSYMEEGFDFSNPKVLSTLFSPAAGAFFYSPLLLIGLLGYARLRGEMAPLVLPVLFGYAVKVLLIASWWTWWLGCSCAHRGFVDVIPLSAPGIAALLAWAGGRSWRWLAHGLLALLLCLATYQTLLCWEQEIPAPCSSRLSLRQYVNGVFSAKPLKVLQRNYKGYIDELTGKMPGNPKSWPCR